MAGSPSTQGSMRRLRELRIRPNRELGQNFLVDANVLPVIGAAAELGERDTVLEVGGGLGVLSEYLAEHVEHVHVVEVDRRLEPALALATERFANVALYWEDAMRTDLARLRPVPRKLVANLPYGVATAVLLRTIDELPALGVWVVMVQREVGERMAATVGDTAYGSVSVRIAYFARAAVVGHVPASVFVPRPRVESVLVRVDRLPSPAVDPALVSYGRLEAVVKAGFGHRRKMLRRSLAGTVEPEAFVRAGVRPDARAEELTVADWGRLAAL